MLAAEIQSQGISSKNHPPSCLLWLVFVFSFPGDIAQSFTPKSRVGTASAGRRCSGNPQEKSIGESKSRSRKQPAPEARNELAQAGRGCYETLDVAVQNEKMQAGA